jgi:hypothetical protein
MPPLLALLPQSPGGEERLRAEVRRLLGDLEGQARAASTAIAALGACRDAASALALLTEAAPALHAAVANDGRQILEGYLEALLLLAPGDLAERLQGLVDAAGPAGAPWVGFAAASAGCADVAARAFEVSWSQPVDEARAWGAARQALLAAGCQLPRRLELARRALDSLEPHVDSLGPALVPLLGLLGDQVLLPEALPEDRLARRRERVVLRAGLRL